MNVLVTIEMARDQAGGIHLLNLCLQLSPYFLQIDSS